MEKRVRGWLYTCYLSHYSTTVSIYLTTIQNTSIRHGEACAWLASYLSPFTLFYKTQHLLTNASCYMSFACLEMNYNSGSTYFYPFKPRITEGYQRNTVDVGRILVFNASLLVSSPIHSK